jgi:hypothetical protein
MQLQPNEVSCKALLALIPADHLDLDEPLRNISCSGTGLTGWGKPLGSLGKSAFEAFPLMVLMVEKRFLGSCGI